MELYAIEVRTERWLQSLAWYREALGLQVAVRIPEEEYALLIAGGARIALMGRDSAGANDRISLAFEVEDVDDCERSLTDCKVEFERIRDQEEGLEIISTSDPDGNRVNLFQWPRP